MPDAISPVAARWIRRWLILIGLMVYAMILIGGATRLTDSGLSITEWEPIKGALPPFGEAAWLAEFEKYKQTAEFQQQNYNMTMSEFQYIYWWEWGHRLFGRLIGLVAIAGFRLVRRQALDVAQMDGSPDRPDRAGRITGLYRLVDGRQRDWRHRPPGCRALPPDDAFWIGAC